jgi:arylsulfatase A-like enzyme
MDRAIPFISKAAENKQPFFATVWFHEPHEPVVAGPEYREMYAQYSEGEQHYYGCITAMDEQIGRLRKELRNLGIAENTMVWFCSDNGPEGMTSKGEPDWCKNSRGVTGGLRGRKRSLFEGGLLGPALLEWSGHARPGRVVDVPCSTLDYLPTIQQLLGYEMPDKRPIDGINRFPSGSSNPARKRCTARRHSPSWITTSNSSPTFLRMGRRICFLIWQRTPASKITLFPSIRR